MAPHLQQPGSNSCEESSNGHGQVVLTQQQQQTDHSTSTVSHQTHRRSRPTAAHNKASNNSSLAAAIPPGLRNYVIPYHGDFCVSPSFHPALISQLMAAGFLPIATDKYLLPKLHRERCVVPLNSEEPFRVGKSVRKKTKRFAMTINQQYDQVVAGCHEQHGDSCWLYPDLVEAFRHIHRHNQPGMLAPVFLLDSNNVHQKRMCIVRLYSLEVYDARTDELVAGELGYSVGSIYTSLTGFTRQDSAGTIQLFTLGKLLQYQGFTLWDLGMDMVYKRSLGSIAMKRSDFVAWVQAERENHRIQLPDLTEPTNCRDIIDGSTFAPSGSMETGESTTSKAAS